MYTCLSPAVDVRAACSLIWALAPLPAALSHAVALFLHPHRQLRTVSVHSFQLTPLLLCAAAMCKCMYFGEWLNACMCCRNSALYWETCYNCYNLLAESLRIFNTATSRLIYFKSHSWCWRTRWVFDYECSLKRFSHMNYELVSIRQTTFHRHLHLRSYDAYMHIYRVVCI